MVWEEVLLKNSISEKHGQYRLARRKVKFHGPMEKIPLKNSWVRDCKTRQEATGEP